MFSCAKARALAWFVNGIFASSVCAGELDSRAILAKPFVFVEAAVQMLAYAASATGDQAAAACITITYFGSPPGTRLFVEDVWRTSDHPADLVIAYLMSKQCAGKVARLEAVDSMWKYTHSSDVQIDDLGDGAVAVDAGIRVLVRRAQIEKQDDAARCIAEQFRGEALFNSVAARLKSNDHPSLTKTTFQVVRALCGYPKDVIAEAVTPPPIADLWGAARERILVVRDLKACESHPEGERADCIKQLDDARSGKMIDEAIRGNDKELNAKHAQIDAMRSAAWRLPDGRLLFQSEKGEWYFEDGSIVAPEVAATRVRPPK